MKTTIKERQTLLDISLQKAGHIEAVMALVEANGVSLTDETEDGKVLAIPELAMDMDARTVALYSAYGIEPATGLSCEDTESCRYGGVGFMGIEVDFEVY